MRHTLSPDYLVSCNYTIWSLQTHSNFERHWRRSYADRKCCQYIFCNIFIGIVAQSSRLLNINIYIYVWKLNQTVLEFDFWAVKFLSSLDRIWTHTIDTLQHHSLGLTSSVLDHSTTSTPYIYISSLLRYAL